MNDMGADQGGRQSGPAPLWRPARAGLLLRHAHGEGGAPVEAPRLFARVVVLRSLLTVAHAAEPVRTDAVAREVVANRVRAALAERQVVFGRADVAGVAFDLDPQARVLAQCRDR